MTSNSVEVLVDVVGGALRHFRRRIELRGRRDVRADDVVLLEDERIDLHETLLEVVRENGLGYVDRLRGLWRSKPVNGLTYQRRLRARSDKRIKA